MTRLDGFLYHKTIRYICINTNDGNRNSRTSVGHEQSKPLVEHNTNSLSRHIASSDDVRCLRSASSRFYVTLLVFTRVRIIKTENECKRKFQLCTRLWCNDRCVNNYRCHSYKGKRRDEKNNVRVARVRMRFHSWAKCNPHLRLVSYTPTATKKLLASRPCPVRLVGFNF